MFNTLKKRIKNEKGLSLVELLAVIVILAIVAAIAIPSIGNIINNQRDKAILSDISGLVAAAKIAVADGSCGSDNICTYNSSDATKNEIEFKSSKIATGEVDLTNANSTDPLIKVTYGTDISYKGSRAADLKTNFATANTAFKESKLNEFMSK